MALGSYAKEKSATKMLKFPMDEVSHVVPASQICSTLCEKFNAKHFTTTSCIRRIMSPHFPIPANAIHFIF